MILSWSNCYEKIKADPKWKTIKAIQDNKVYAVPSGPFNWFDRPPSVNRVLGLKWLGNLLYPEVYDYDIAEEVREFYKMFYHYDLTDEDIEFLLKDAGGK
jgi:iron complex transport system substrate-binding protein